VPRLLLAVGLEVFGQQFAKLFAQPQSSFSRGSRVCDRGGFIAYARAKLTIKDCHQPSEIRPKRVGEEDGVFLIGLHRARRVSTVHAPSLHKHATQLDLTVRLIGSDH